MMAPKEVDLSRLPERRVARASLLLRLGVGGGAPDAIVVLDADTAEFVRVPWLSTDRITTAGLSRDGRHVLLVLPSSGWPDGRKKAEHCRLTLETGEQFWFSASDGAGATDHVAGLSPDGATIATLTLGQEDDDDDDGGYAAVELIDVATSKRRRLWQATGGWSAESVVTWSSDGRLLAVTYLTVGEDDFEHAYVVLDASEGTVLEHRTPEAVTLNSTNGAWTSTGELLTIENNRAVVATFGPAGTRHEFGPWPNGIPWALQGDRFVTPVESGSGREAYEVVTTDLTGGDPRPFLTIRPYLMVRNLEPADHPTATSSPSPTSRATGHHSGPTAGAFPRKRERVNGDDVNGT